MPKKLSEKEIFKTKLFKIKDINLEFDNGRKFTYQILEKNDSVIIVPLKDNGNIILIKEFMVAANEYQWDLPGGRVEKGELPEIAANKELQEEIGFKANQLNFLGVFDMSPGYLTQKVYLYIAQDLEESELEGDEEEGFEIFEHPFEEFEKLIEGGKIKEARAIAALFLARKYLESNLPYLDPRALARGMKS